ncbi:MAG TPA: bifunctional UDP-sugar hydrolase/5'-nucleotidase [Bryobacterales bacterium]|nr:bifunctional UDP-sugar hydrolase/5'-nucleotidase [Bryobacterales bacterium]
MRKITALRFTLLGLLLFVALAPAEQRELIILHTNDLHARFLPGVKKRGGFAQLAAVIRHERDGCRSCILLNAGDLTQGTPVSTLFHGVPVYEVANLLGFDVSTLGNHEFDYGWQKVLQFLQVARFPTVSANVVDAQDRLLTPHAYLIRSVNGVRVAILGVMTGDLATLSTPDLLGPWHAAPVIETVRRYAAELRNKSDLIVVLGHITGQEEDALLREVPDVPVIVSGHLHTGLQEPKIFDGRLDVRVAGYGEELGRLELLVDVPRKSVARWTWKRLPVDASTIPPAADVAKVVAGWEAKVSKIVDVPIGESKREFSVAEVKTLIEKAMCEEMHADFAFMNKGGVRDFLPQGTILARHVWNIMPFDNRVVTGRFQGSQLPPAVTKGRSIDPNREYTLAISDFIAANQKTELGASGLVFPVKGPLQRDLIIDWVKKQKVLQ